MYKILIIPLAAGLIAQAVKIFIKTNGQKPGLKDLAAYSGMPSGHSAIVAAFALIAGLEEGWHSPVFALGVIFAVIVIRDALGIRRYLGQHGKTLNVLVRDLKDDRILDEHYPHLLERIGHTPAQVAVGAALGCAVSLLGYWLF